MRAVHSRNVNGGQASLEADTFFSRILMRKQAMAWSIQLALMGVAATAGAQATSTVPIVGPSMGEDVVLNLAGINYARPKGNVTGILFTAASGCPPPSNGGWGAPATAGW